MNNYIYDVTINKKGTKKGTEITGKLTGISCKYDTESSFPYLPEEISFSLDFNPLTILGDLRNKKQPYEYPYGRLNIDRAWKYLLDSYQYEYGFGESLYIGNDEQYLKLISALDKIMRTSQCRTLEDLEEIQHTYKLELDCKILVERHNIYYDLLKKRNRHIEKSEYTPLEYEFGKTNDELIKSTYMNKNHRFYYHCSSMAEVIFAILHFIVVHQYEFKTCALCQKRYVKIPNKGQGKYCPRINPLGTNPNFTDNDREKLKELNCQEAMSKFHEIMRNKKKYKTTYASTEESQIRFENEFAKCNDKVKSSPVTKNIIELYSFVTEYKFQE